MMKRRTGGDDSRRGRTAVGIAIGVALGAGFGIATDELAIGLSARVAVGVAIGYALERRGGTKG